MGCALLITWDGAGNLPPELSLVKGLIGRGHTVHVLGHRSQRRVVEQAGCGFIGVNSFPDLDLTKGLSPGEELPRILNEVWFGREYLDDTRSAIDALSPDLLLVDANLGCAHAAALASRVPSLSLCHSLYELVIAGPFADAFSPRVPELNEVLEPYGWRPFANYRQVVEACHRVIVFSYQTFDTVGAQSSPKVVHVGPLRTPPVDAPEWIRRFPDKPLLLVSLSTSDQGQGPLLQRLCDVCSSLPVETVVTTGPSVDPASLATSGDVLAIRYAPHDQILPQVDLLLTHSGHGTVMAGVTHGVPMVCLPIGRDQHAVAGRVTELGLGLEVDQSSSVEEIREVVRTALGNSAVRTRCRQFAEGLGDHPGITQAVQIAEELMGQE